MKSLLTTTAAALLMGTAALAQGEIGTPLRGIGDVSGATGSLMASDLIGQRLYATPDALPAPGADIDAEAGNWNDIGEINDLVVGADGTLRGIIVGIGGFLGLNERQIAVSMDEVETYRAEGDRRFLVIQASEQDLAALPAFDRGELAGTTAEARPGAEILDEDAPERDVDESPLTDQDGPQEEVETIIAQGEDQPGRDNTDFMTRGDLDLADDEADSPLEGEADAPDRPLVGDGPLVDEEAFAARNAPATAEDLTGSTVYGLNDEVIGNVNDLVLAEDGTIRLLIIDVGGFLSIGEKPVAIPFDQVRMLPPDTGQDQPRLFLPASAEQLAAMDAWEE